MEAYSSAANTARRLADLDRLTLPSRRPSNSGDGSKVTGDSSSVGSAGSSNRSASRGSRSPPRPHSGRTTSSSRSSPTTKSNRSAAVSKSPATPAALSDRPELLPEEVLPAVVDASSLSAKDVFLRYQQKDVNAITVLEETAEHLAVMVINICRVVDPVGHQN